MGAVTPDEKLTVKLAALSTTFRDTAAVAREQALTILADAERAMKRAIKRAEALSEEWERQEIRPQSGPVVEFTGRLVAEQNFTTEGDDPMGVDLEIWETQGGAYVAVTVSEPVDRPGFELVKATVVEPQDNRQAMHFAVMEHFDWTDRARSLARKAGWDLRMEVE